MPLYDDRGLASCGDSWATLMRQVCISRLHNGNDKNVQQSNDDNDINSSVCLRRNVIVRLSSSHWHNWEWCGGGRCTLIGLEIQICLVCWFNILLLHHNALNEYTSSRRQSSNVEHSYTCRPAIDGTQCDKYSTCRSWFCLSSAASFTIGDRFPFQTTPKTRPCSNGMSN